MEWVKVKNLIQRLSFFVCSVGMFLLIPLMFFTTADVIGRNFLRKPIPGIIELSEYALATVILLGIGYTQQVKGHVGVSFLTSRISPRNAAICQIVSSAIGLFIIGCMVYQGLIIGLKERTVSDMLRVPQYPFRLLVAFGGFLLWLEILIDFVSSIRKVKER